MIAIGSDHAGFELKQSVIAHLKENGIEYKDFGCYDMNSVDYPAIAETTCKAIVNGDCERGILICGTGIGISIAANKVQGIRAACCSDYFSAKYTRLHNVATVICMAGRVLGAGLANELVDVFLHTDYEGGRHARRVAMIHEIEQRQK